MDANGGFYADLFGLADEAPTAITREFNEAPAVVATLLQKQFSAGRRCRTPANTKQA